ncbi:DUF1772 domain-containing protein [Streptomyces aidingensis]|nr:anthrone oxygenase family protein [Streptomyces aidingensis]
MNPDGTVLAAATLLTGLMAGLFFAFSCAVMPGLARTGDRAFVSAMQWINVRILNPWFGPAFAGAPVLTAVAALLHLDDGQRAELGWTVAGFLCYAVQLAITGRINVPLNNRLAGAGEPADAAAAAAVRQEFEARWVRWNLVRTVAVIAAFGCLLAALLARG